MTFNLPDAFHAKYSSEIKVRAQQMRRKLEGASEEGGTFIGDFFYSPRFGSTETYKASRLQELTLSNSTIDWLKKEAEPEFVAFGLWDPDKNKTSLNMAGQFAGATVRAVNRARDRQHIDCLKDVAANGIVNTKGVREDITTIGDYNTVCDLEAICEAIVELGTSEMWEGEQISIITPFKVQVNNSLDPYIAKNDVKGNRPWDNLIWRAYERMPGNGTGGVGWLKDPKTKVATDATGVDIFVHAKSAVVNIENDNDKEINERLGSRLGDMFGRWFQSASMATEPSGIIRIKSKLDFDLFRKSIPIIDTAVP